MLIITISLLTNSQPNSAATIATCIYCQLGIWNYKIESTVGH